MQSNQPINTKIDDNLLSDKKFIDNLSARPSTTLKTPNVNKNKSTIDVCQLDSSTTLKPTSTAKKTPKHSRTNTRASLPLDNFKESENLDKFNLKNDPFSMASPRKNISKINNEGGLISTRNSKGEPMFT